MTRTAETLGPFVPLWLRVSCSAEFLVLFVYVAIGHSRNVVAYYTRQRLVLRLFLVAGRKRFRLAYPEPKQIADDPFRVFLLFIERWAEVKIRI